MRYFFDMRENDEIAIDEIGLELPNIQAAEVEGAQSLADLARELQQQSEPRPSLSVEVRTDSGPLFKAALIRMARPH